MAGGHTPARKTPSGGGSAGPSQEDRTLRQHARLLASSLVHVAKNGATDRRVPAVVAADGAEPISPVGRRGSRAPGMGPGLIHGSLPRQGMLSNMIGSIRDTAGGDKRADGGAGGVGTRVLRRGHTGKADALRRALTHGSPGGPGSSCSSSASSSVYSGTGSPRVTLAGADGEVAERVRCAVYFLTLNHGAFYSLTFAVAAIRISMLGSNLQNGIM